MIEFVKGFLKITTMAVLAAIVISLAYLAGFGSGATWSSPVSGTALASFHLLPAAESMPPPSGDAALDKDFRVFWEAWRLIDRDFYDPLPDTRQRTYGAIRGMLQSLKDEHTAFLDPEQAAVLQSDDSGSFEGIGASIRLDETIGLPRIVQPFAGQPAAQAGLKSGDIILKVDAKATENLTVFEVVTLIRGPRGSTVHLTIKREGVEEPLDVPVVRDRVDIPVVESRMLDQGIAYLRLTDFNNLATQKVKAALTDLLQQKPHGLIFDLRSNPGGFLHVAVEIGSQFVAKGNIVTEKSKDGAEEAFPVQPGGLVTDPALPVVVLVNAGTASASEIVAAAIRDTGRGILIGERTFGKSSVQIPHDLSDGSELRVTIAKWFTPKGDQITGGLTPDIEVKLTTEDMTAKRDPQLDRAVEYLVNGK